MEPQTNAPANEIHQVQSMRWWVSVGIVLILIVLLIGVQTAVRFAQNLGPVIPQSSPDRMLLGGWREISSIRYDETGSSSPQVSDYATSTDGEFLGFVMTNGIGNMRSYSSPGSANTLYLINSWMAGSSSPQDLSIDIFAYGTTSSDNLLRSSAIHFLSPDTMVMRTEYSGISRDEETFARIRSADAENAMDFTRTDAQNQELCDEIFAGTSTTYSVSPLLPITCTTDIGPGDNPATFDFGIDGSLTVKSGDQVILELHNGDPLADDASNTIDLIDNGAASGPFLSDLTDFTLQDFTFDGYKDIKVLTNSGAYNFTYDYYQFLPRNGMYDPVPIVTAVNPEFDPETRTITGFDKGRGIGDIYTTDTYRFQDGKYVLVERVTQDLKDQQNYDSSSGYVQTDEKLVNGKLRIVKTTFLSEADVMGDQSDPIINGN